MFGADSFAASLLTGYLAMRLASVSRRLRPSPDCGTERSAAEPVLSGVSYRTSTDEDGDGSCEMEGGVSASIDRFMYVCSPEGGTNYVGLLVGLCVT